MSQRQPIAAGWKLADFAPGEGLRAGAHAPTSVDEKATWLDIAVPGDVHRTLIDAGRIPDPFYEQNETACAWMEQREWWYRTTFERAFADVGEDERVLLVLHGLDTFTTVYLNGEELGEHHNMFRPAIFDVTRRLSDQNVIAVCFEPPLECIAGKTQSEWGRNPERTPMRKAQFGYGWDWGPRLPTIGIWRPVELVRQRRANVLGAHFYTLEVTPTRERAACAVRIEVEAFASAGPLRAGVRMDGIEAEVELHANGALLEGTAYLTLEHPRLWWTHDLGEPALYDLEVELLEGELSLDTSAQRVGIRTLALDQSPDPEERGTTFFRFVLNGVPIFARGADWIPCDSFVGAIQPDRRTALLEQARDANMTMLRIWGGGIYEDDQFYAECDRLGLLVWQDFMFACAMYPEDDADFVREVDAEARYQVRRLRSHPCLALWCGNNENQWLHERRYWDRAELPPYGARYYDAILPAAVGELDGRTPYWPGSPYGGNDHNDRDHGNVHNWEVWHGNFPRRFGEEPRREPTPRNVSFVRYAEDMGRFISEFGMHAAPIAETLRRVIPADQLYHHSAAMDWHNKDNPKNKGDDLMLGTTGLPNTLDEYIAFSQIAQAEGLKFGVEHFRRRKPHCSGTLVWQLDDCWPVLSWSIIDYYGFGKAGYYYLARAYASVLASFKALPDGGLELWLTNDTLSAVSDTAQVRLGAFDGRVVSESTHAVDIPANASRRVARFGADALHAAPEHYLSVRSDAGSFVPNRHFFVPIKDLPRVAVPPEMHVASVNPRELRVTLRAPRDSYVYFAHLTSPSETTRFSDNYIDLEPGESRELRVSDAARELEAADLTLGWA